MAVFITPRSKLRLLILVDCYVVWFWAIGHYLRLQAQNTHLGGYEFMHIFGRNVGLER